MNKTRASVLQTLQSSMKFMALFAAMLILACLLLIAKTEQVLKTTVEGVVLAQVQPLKAQTSAAYALGIYPESFLSSDKLQETTAGAPRIVSLNWKTPTDPVPEKTTGEHTQHLRVPVHNSFDVEIGHFDLAFTMPELPELQTTLKHHALQWVPWLLALSFLVGAIYSRWFVQHTNSVVCVLGTLAMMALAYPMFESIGKYTEPLVRERVKSIATAQQQLWNVALHEGFSHQDFEDIPTALEKIRKEHAELGKASIKPAPAVIPTGSAWIVLDMEQAIELTPNPDFLHQLQQELLLDYLTLAVIAFFFWAQFSKSKPAEHAANKTGLWCPALFIYFLSEELIRPLLPGLAAQLPSSILDTSTASTWVGGLSISVFMLLVALAQPFLNHITSTSKARRFFTIGCLLSASGQVLTLLTPNAEYLLLGRALAGLGYACVFVAGQTVLLLAYGPKKRAAAFASLVTAIMAATVVGPAFGGLLADNLGQSATLILAFIVPLISPLLVWKQHGIEQNNGAFSQMNAPKPSPFAGLNQPRLLALSLLAAAPAKMLLTGLLFFLVPLMAIGSSSLDASNTGRILLVYGLLMLILAPKCARYLQQGELGLNRAAKFVSSGLMVSACAGLLPLINLFSETPMFADAMVGLGIALALGIGQSLSISAQGSLVQLYQQRFSPSQAEFSWLGSYRLLERTGNALGPMLAALCLQFFNLNQVVLVFASTALLLGMLCWFALQTTHKGAAHS